MGRHKKENYEQLNLFSNNISFYKKANALINSKGNVSLMGLKLFTIAIMNAQYDEAMNRTFAVIGTGQLRNLLGNTGSSLYTNIREQIDNGRKNSGSLLDWRIIYEDKEKHEFMISSVITDAAFRKGTLTVCFNNNLKDYIINLNKGFTLLNCKEQLSLTSHYSFRLYEVFKQKLDMGKFINTKNGMTSEDVIQWDVNITELKLILGIIDQKDDNEIKKILLSGDVDYDEIEKLSRQSGNKKYKTYASFKQNALARAIKEINEKTSVHVDFVERKAGLGGKVSSISFYIDSKKNADSSPQKIEDNVLTSAGDDFIISQIQSITGLSHDDSHKLAEVSGWDIQKVTKAYNLPGRQNAKNLTGWMMAAIKNNYSASEINNGTKAFKNTFNYFEQNNVNYDELEEMLLDN